MLCTKLRLQEDKSMRIRRKDGHMDREMLLLLAIGAFMAAIGILAFVSALTGVNLENIDLSHLVGMLAGLSGCLFGIFLLAGEKER